MRAWWAVVCFVIGISVAAGATAQVESSVEASAEGTERPAPFVYQASGRRDPFVQPGLERQVSCAHAGLRGVRVRDVSLRGIVQTRHGFVLLLAGPSGESYVAREGDALCDGSVISIEPACAELGQETDPLDSQPGPRRFRLLLHGE